MLELYMAHLELGTGKTRSLVDLAEQEARRRAVMFLSYTKVAAAEAASRIGDGKTLASTIHSLAFQNLNMVRAQVVDDVKLREFSAIAGIQFRQGIDDEEQDGDRYRSVLSYARSMMIEPEDAYEKQGSPGTLRGYINFVQQYTQWKTTYGFMDFDDMLLQASVMDFNPPPVVILDEAQDCSPLQWKVFNQYVASAARVYVAGDDDQAIFEWNGADPHGMMKFSDEHNAKVKVLDQSWRVPKSVHTFLHDEVLAQFETRVDKKFNFSEREGALHSWSDLQDTDMREITSRDKSNLILVRDSFRMREIQKALHADMIPYAIAGSRPSPYESGLASAIRGLQSGNPTAAEAIMMKKHARDPNASTEDILGKDWRNAFKIPTYLMEFYENADLNAPLNTKISTIHQAKGTEAENVIVDLTITPRVAEGIAANRDAELRVWYVAFSRTKDTLHICGENDLFE